MRYESVQMAIRRPAGMADEEAIRRAKALVPCEVGAWEGDGEQYPDGLCGLMDCEEGFYDGAPRYSAYGPDDAGVEVEWEKP